MIEWYKLSEKKPVQERKNYLTYTPYGIDSGFFSITYWHKSYMDGKTWKFPWSTITHWAELEKPKENK